MNKKIEISKTGYILCESYDIDDENSGEKIQKIFLNALIKYQTDNPFRRNLNRNAPLILLLNVLKLLKNNRGTKGIHRKELAFLMCWDNNDYNKLYNFIALFREKYGFKASDEIIYEECLKLLGSDNKKDLKCHK